MITKLINYPSAPVVPRVGGRERVAHGGRGRRVAAAARARAAARALRAARAQRQARRALRRQDHARRQVSILSLVPGPPGI